MTPLELFEKNTRLAYSLASRYLINYKAEFEDIKQVALMGLWKACTTYNPTVNTTKFSSYAWIVISNEINYYLRKNNNAKLANLVSLCTPISNNKGEESSLEELLQNPIDVINNSDNLMYLDSIFDILDKLNLTDKQRLMFQLYLEDRNQAEIGKIVGINQASVSRAIKRIKNQIKKVLDEHERIDFL